MGDSNLMPIFVDTTNIFMRHGEEKDTLCENAWLG